MKIEKISIFLAALLLLATASGTVAAANSNNSTNTTYNITNNITTKEQALSRVNYLENQIGELQFQIGTINKNINQKNDQIKNLNSRLLLACYKNDLGQYKLIECKINNLKSDINALEVQKTTLLNTRNSFSWEMEDLKIKWGIIDPA
ncbi:hypothetical protein Metbo_1969 [Methanobacterium lacus]|uniref:Uncharacterized protein n=1 Tax=Methanobacterium lacus (strain AL-21) TaxID=877455 RepID=F0TB43_METLA|nr:hypothetical protein [Methanobacterium lacus]ADZ10189.1 hypothetical protein Metbo_1969 [Methanobacterium lacus]